MKEWLAFIAFMLLYSGVTVFFGAWAEMKYVNYKMPTIIQASWRDGCNQCAQFEKDAQSRDQLQGVAEHPKAIE